MDTLSALAAPPSLLQAPSNLTAAELAKRGQIEKTAQAFESSFLSTIMGTMMSGLSTEPPFGGGEGEAMWRSFLGEAIAKQMTKRGGIGIAHTVAAEMLKLQGATAQPAAATAAAGGKS